MTDEIDALNEQLKEVVKGIENLKIENKALKNKLFDTYKYLYRWDNILSARENKYVTVCVIAHDIDEAKALILKENSYIRSAQLKLEPVKLSNTVVL